MELVSILIPVFNREVLIREAICSALVQTYSNFEIIVVDNCSTDGTWNVIQQCAKMDSRIKAYRNDTNIGPVRNWQRCVSEANGKYGKLLFSDDLMIPHFLERTVPYLDDPDVAFVITAVTTGDCYHAEVISDATRRESKQLTSEQYFSLLFARKVPYSPGAGIFRMSDIQANLRTSFPTKIPRDFSTNGAGPDVLLYALTAMNYGYVIELSEKLVFFRLHQGSFTVHNQNNGVTQGYRSAMAWFYKYQQSQYWAKYVVMSWMWDMFKVRRTISLKEYVDTYEGNGGVGELIKVLFAILLLPGCFYKAAAIRRKASVLNPKTCLQVIK